MEWLRLWAMLILDENLNITTSLKVALYSRITAALNLINQMRQKFDQKFGRNSDVAFTFAQILCQTLNLQSNFSRI